MKRSLLTTLALLPCFALAATSPTSIPPDVAHELSVMTTKLKLSESQQDRIRPILVAEFNKKQAIENSTLSDRQKHDQVGSNHRAALQKIKALFTPEQLALIEEDQNHPSTSSTRPKSRD